MKNILPGDVVQLVSDILGDEWRFEGKPVKQNVVELKLRDFLAEHWGLGKVYALDVVSMLMDREAEKIPTKDNTKGGIIFYHNGYVEQGKSKDAEAILVWTSSEDIDSVKAIWTKKDGMQKVTIPKPQLVALADKEVIGMNGVKWD